MMFQRLLSQNDNRYILVPNRKASPSDEDESGVTADGISFRITDHQFTDHPC
jgi:hypothetical protein